MNIRDVEHVVYDLGSVNLSALKRECTKRARLYNERWQVWIHGDDDKIYQRMLGFEDMRRFRVRHGWWIIPANYYRNPADDNYQIVHESKGELR